MKKFSWMQVAMMALAVGAVVLAGTGVVDGNAALALGVLAGKLSGLLFPQVGRKVAE